MCEWDLLPDIALEKILQYLSWRDRLSCALVCHNWNDVFYSPVLWHELIVTELQFTRCRFNLYGGYRDEISHRLVQNYLGQIGAYIRRIIVLPNSNYFNLYGFIHVLFNYLEFFEEYPMPNLERFELTFNCENHTPMGHQISGTGGHILEGLRRLLYNFKNLNYLTYNELLLSNQDAHGVVDDLLVHNKDSLRFLELVNFTAQRFPLFPVARFKKLHTLLISPQNLTDDVAIMLAESCPTLQRLVIVQDNYSPVVDVSAVSLAGWWQVKEANPLLRVRLLLRGPTPSDMDPMIQENAPVDEVIYRSPYSITKTHIVLRVSDEYSQCIRKYCMFGLPRKHGSRSFKDRADSGLILLVRECPKLKTLVIRERISTSTLLLIAGEGKALQTLKIRRNGLILKCDWPLSPDWSDEFYRWLRSTSKDYDRTEIEVGKLLGFDWKMMTDRAFKALEN